MFSFKWILIWLALWWTCVTITDVICKRGPRSFIALDDHDFVGDDPVLAAELARRMAQTPKEDFLMDIKTEEHIASRKGKKRKESLKSTDNQAPGLDGIPSRRIFKLEQTDPYWDLKLKDKEDVTGKGHEGKYIEYKQDPNETNLYAMQLKVAEQAIYGIQGRLRDLDRIVNPYKNHRLMRMAFMMKHLVIWYEEMKDFYGYSHGSFPILKRESSWLESLVESVGIKNKRLDPKDGSNQWWFPNIRHLMYYQAMLKRYIDIIYTTEFLRTLHRDEIAEYKMVRKKKIDMENQKKKEEELKEKMNQDKNG